MTDICVITSAHGEVHRVREGRSCATVATAKERRPVTLNQASADQAMADALGDLGETIVTVMGYLADGHDSAEAFLNLLGSFKVLLNDGRGYALAGLAAIAIVSMAESSVKP